MLGGPGWCVCKQNSLSPFENECLPGRPVVRECRRFVYSVNFSRIPLGVTCLISSGAERLVTLLATLLVPSNSELESVLHQKFRVRWCPFELYA